MTEAVQALIPFKGTPITMRQASIKYGVSSATISNWVRYGWVAVLRHGKGVGSKTYVDEHDVAFIALRNDVRQGKTPTELPIKVN